MNKGSDKKVVLFLVEGLSERHALGPKVLELFDRVDGTIEVSFHSEIGDEDTGGDITTNSDVCQTDLPPAGQARGEVSQLHKEFVPRGEYFLCRAYFLA